MKNQQCWRARVGNARVSMAAISKDGREETAATTAVSDGHERGLTS